MIEAQIKLIKELTCNIKLNFLKIGEILAKIRNDDIFKPNHSSFDEFLSSEDFDFSRSHAYNLIKIYEQFGYLLLEKDNGVHLMDKLGYNTLLQIAYVSDKEVRKGLIEEAEKLSKSPVNAPNFDDFRKKVHRVAKRTNEGLISSFDSPKDKLIRLINGILTDIDCFYETKNDMEERITKVKQMGLKFHNDEIIKALLKEIKEKWH